MSLRGILEIVIHVESFRNVDLSHQGLYMLRLHIYNQNEDKKFLAHPYGITQSKSADQRQKKLKSSDYHNLIPAHIVEDLSSFCTKGFLIRYCEEEVELNDIIQFRTELDVVDGYLEEEFFLEAELLFADLVNIGGPEKWQQFSKEVRFNQVLKNVDGRICRAKAKGVFSYIPILFDENHFCIANTMLHSVLLDFRFRKTALKLAKSEEPVRVIENGKKHKKIKHGKQKFTPSDLTEFLFCDYRGVLTHSVNPLEADQIYHDYVKILTVMYDKLSQKFSKYHSKGLNEFQKSEYRKQFEITPLILPGIADINLRLGQENLEEEKKPLKGIVNHTGMNAITAQNTINSSTFDNCMDTIKLEKGENLSEKELESGVENKENTPSGSVLVLNDSEVEHEKSIEEEEENKVIEREDEESKQRIEIKNKLKDELQFENDIDDLKVLRLLSSGSREEVKKRDTDSICDDDNINEGSKIDFAALPIMQLQKKKPISDNLPLSYQNNVKGVPFSLRLATSNPYEIANLMISEINTIAAQTFQLWYKFVELLKVSPKNILCILNTEFGVKISKKFGQNIFRNEIKTKDFTFQTEQNIGDLHKKIAKTKRANIMHEVKDNILDVEDESMFLHRRMIPIIFEDVYIRELSVEEKRFTEERKTEPLGSKRMIGFGKAITQKYKGTHLFVLCHGFQGNSFDMRLIRNHLSLIHPDSLFLCSIENENATEGDLLQQGITLAKEVIQYIKEWCPGSTLGRISFIGHSLGGLIIRASLPFLEDYKEKMYTFLTFSSPHLGYMYNSSKIIEAGMWFLKKWRKSKCLQQLTMVDAKSQYDNVLYKLSESDCLKWFKNIALISSYQDTYAPYESARIEISQKAALDPQKGNIYIRMAQNILSNINISTLYRIDVNFKIKEKNIDSFIGRAAHIQFLENETLMKMIIYRYSEFFA